MTYTWDNNSNLLSDGTNAYTYDHANRLISVVGSATTSSFGYRCNGLSSDPWGIIGCQSDRVSQTVDGMTESYTLDLNNWLTQVLADGTHTYLYGAGRIAQYDSGIGEYFLGDALGSVRQLTDDAGAVTLVKTYQPFGNVMQSIGTDSSPYGFTNEWTDGNGLVYLRARYYEPGIGRFITRDKWRGAILSPITQNGWIYVEDNPVNFTDPSGYITQQEEPYANNIVSYLKWLYKVDVLKDWGFQKSVLGSIVMCRWEDGDWTIKELITLQDGTYNLAVAMGGPGRFIENIGGVSISQESISMKGITRAHRIKFTNSSKSINKWIVVHELAHAWDLNKGRRLSKELQEFTGGHTSRIEGWTKRILGYCDKDRRLPGCNRDGYFYGDVPPAGSDEKLNVIEDFAESVTAYVYPVEAQERIQKYFKDPIYGDLLYYSDYTQTKRWAYVNSLVNRQ